MNSRLSSLAGAVKASSLVSPAFINALAIAALVLFNQLFNVAATLGFARSGLASSLGGFILWQALGSVFGLGTQVTFAGMVRLFSLRFANAVGIGMAFVSAQVFAAYIFMHEPFSPWQWAGTALVFVGILLITFGH